MRALFLLFTAVCLGCGSGAGTDPVPRGVRGRPNLLLLVSDDQGTVLGCYGVSGVQTPRLDALAAAGRRFTAAYAPSGVCTPSRTALYTGLMPAHNGAGGFVPVAEGIPVWGELLADAGFRTGLIGKLGAKPIARFPFDLSARSKKNDEGARSLEWHVDQLDTFLDADDGRPFALVVNFRDSHWPFPTDGAPFGADPLLPHDPALVEVPPELVDLPPVRAEIARFHDGLRRMDATVGALIDRLAARGQLENTLGLFTSDNGPPFPFAKTTLYEAGIHMPLIAFGVGVEPGVDDRFVTLVDILPTALALGGVDVGTLALDGESLLPLLAGQEVPAWRDAVFGSHDGHRLEPHVPSRSVRFGKWKYIRNWGEGLRFENMVMRTSDTWRAMGAAAAAGDTPLAARMQRFVERPREELYDLEADPREMVNLAAHADARAALVEARQRLADTELVTLPPD